MHNGACVSILPYRIEREPGKESKQVIRNFHDIGPMVDPTAYVAETAVIIGDVEIGPQSSVWFIGG